MKDRVRKDRFDFLQSFAKAFYGVGLVSHPVSQGLLDWSFILAMMASPKATIDCIDAFGTTDFRPDLAAFTVPTLIIHGTADKTVPIDVAGRAAAKGIPHADFLEYEGEPHGLFATAADRLTTDLLNFVASSVKSPPHLWGGHGYKRAGESPALSIVLRVTVQCGEPPDVLVLAVPVVDWPVDD